MAINKIKVFEIQGRLNTAPAEVLPYSKNGNRTCFLDYNFVDTYTFCFSDDGSKIKGIGYLVQNQKTKEIS